MFLSALQYWYRLQLQASNLGRLLQGLDSLPCQVCQWLNKKYWQLFRAHLLTQPACLVGLPALLACLPCWPTCLAGPPALLARLPCWPACLVGLPALPACFVSLPALFWSSSLALRLMLILKRILCKLTCLKQSTFLRYLWLKQKENTGDI